MFRKEEIIDLSKAIESNEKATNEQMLKREKLQTELEKIEEETFELEKKYGKVDIELNVESDPASSDDQEVLASVNSDGEEVQENKTVHSEKNEELEVPEY